MNENEKIRLMVKFRIKACSGGIYGKGFLDGLQATEDYKIRPRITSGDVEVPK